MSFYNVVAISFAKIQKTSKSTKHFSQNVKKLVFTIQPFTNVNAGIFLRIQPFN